MRNWQDASHDEMHQQVGFAHRGSLNLNNVFAIDSMRRLATIECGPPYVPVQARNTRGPWWISCVHDQQKNGMDVDKDDGYFLPVRKPTTGKRSAGSHCGESEMRTAKRELESRSLSGSTMVVMTQLFVTTALHVVQHIISLPHFIAFLCWQAHL